MYAPLVLLKLVHSFHANLERLGNYLLDNNKQWRDLNEEDQQNLCRTVAEEILQENQGGEETSDAYQKAIEQRVQRTLHVTVDRLVEWSKRSDFDTKYLEQDFGRQGGWDPIRVPLGKTVIYASSVKLTVSMNIQGMVKPMAWLLTTNRAAHM